MPLWQRKQGVKNLPRAVSCNETIARYVGYITKRTIILCIVYILAPLMVGYPGYKILRAVGAGAKNVKIPTIMGTKSFPSDPYRCKICKKCTFKRLTHPRTHLLNYRPTHPITNPKTQPPTHSLAHSPTDRPIHPPIYTHSLTHNCDPCTHPFTHSATDPPIYSLANSATHSPTNPPIHSLTLQ